jgi:hypothetical protein
MLLDFALDRGAIGTIAEPHEREKHELFELTKGAAHRQNGVSRRVESLPRKIADDPITNTMSGI